MGLQQTSLSFNNLSFPHYYLCNYLPVSVGQDILSQSLLRFKRGYQPDLDAWIDCSLEILAGAPLLPDTIIIRALNHNETTVPHANPTSLDHLGKALATHFHFDYCPGLLQKSRPAREIKSLSREHREMELHDLYHIDEDYYGRLAGHPILLLDDILTTGTTMKMIIRALGKHSTSVSIFTLAKADYDDSLNKITPLKGQNYQLQQGLGWQVAEEEQAYYSLSWLKAQIKGNSF
jgi:predicted amidophosphoribosyltransferase